MQQCLRLYITVYAYSQCLHLCINVYAYVSLFTPIFNVYLFVQFTPMYECLRLYSMSTPVHQCLLHSMSKHMKYFYASVQYLRLCTLPTPAAPGSLGLLGMSPEWRRDRLRRMGDTMEDWTSKRGSTHHH